MRGLESCAFYRTDILTVYDRLVSKYIAAMNILLDGQVKRNSLISCFTASVACFF